MFAEHINAPVADFPIRRMIGGRHLLADITLPYGRVLHDYLAPGAQTTSAATPAPTPTPAAAPSLLKVSSEPHVEHAPDAIPSCEKQRTHHGYLTRQRILASSGMPLSAPSFSMPLSLPAELRNVRHVDREYFVIKYQSTHGLFS